MRQRGPLIDSTPPRTNLVTRSLLCSAAARVALLSAAFLVAAPHHAKAQQRITGFSPASAARQRSAESDAIAKPDATRAATHARMLSREPHVAGTDAQARTRDYVIDQMKSWGLQTEVRAYDVWLPHATSVRLWRTAPSPMEIPLGEPPIASDPVSSAPQYPAVNGYSAAGDVSAEGVYVNYGPIEDYEQLAAIGDSVRGKIAMVRYGRSARGIRAREPERKGAHASIQDSDPADDGYGRGDVYPEGPMRPPAGLQRGSVMNAVGDPATPGWPSTRGQRRVPRDSMQVPRIPVVAIGYGAATELLRGLRGADIPQSWQGGLPFRYHAGPGPVVARVAVTDDAGSRGTKTIWNTYGILRGTEFPDELVIIGAHRDAWCAGAVDNVSGTVSVLEAARVLAEQARRGLRPKRTIVFATWDAEEWGLIGSTEYVEDDSLRLMRGAVAYLNQDVSASGSQFGAGGSPSLRPMLREIVRQVPHPLAGTSVYAEWRRATAVADSAEPRMGDPGGGSDFAGFYNHLGIPHADWGFGGPGGIYHSAYDTHRWMTTFGDTNHSHHAASARIAAAMLLRLANADVLPYDYVEFARTMRNHLGSIERLSGAQDERVQVDELRAAIDRMERAAAEFAAARDAALASEVKRQTREATNRALLRVERALTRPEGLRTRPWYRNLIYAADENNGYSNVVFPSVSEAIRAGDEALVEGEIADLARRFDAATAALRVARSALEAR